MAIEIYVGEGERLVMTPSQVLEHATRIGAGTVVMNHIIGQLREQLAESRSFIEELGGIPGVSNLNAMSERINKNSQENFQLLQERMRLRSICVLVSQYLDNKDFSAADRESLSIAIKNELLDDCKNSMLLKVVPVEATSAMCAAGARFLSDHEDEHYEMMGRFMLAYSAALEAL